MSLPSRPRKARTVNRALVFTAAGALIAAGGMASARADTVITGEGILMPRGTTAKQFGGALCQTNTCVTTGSAPTDVNAQARRFEAAVIATSGPKVLVGHSLSAAAIERTVAKWQADPTNAPSPAEVRIITTGNPYNQYGGTQRNTRAARAAALPGPIEYDQLDVVVQYGSVEDKPARWGLYSQLELSLAKHQTGYDDVDINDPDNLITADGSYMLIPAGELRQLRLAKVFVSPGRYAELTAERKARIERDYDRPELHEQGPGADWANGVEPESLREDKSWRKDDGESSDTAAAGPSADQTEASTGQGPANRSSGRRTTEPSQSPTTKQDASERREISDQNSSESAAPEADSGDDA